MCRLRKSRQRLEGQSKAAMQLTAVCSGCRQPPHVFETGGLGAAIDPPWA